MKSAHLFISYSRRDEQVVTAFAESLRAKGLEVWQDISGERSGIPYSTKWFEAIESAIHAADGAIIVDSAHWQASKPCHEERRMIEECDLPLLELTAEQLGQNLEDAVSMTLDWVSKRVQTESNYDRSFIVSRAFRFTKRHERSVLLPKISGIKGTRRTLSYLREVSWDADRRFGPSVASSIKDYVIHAKRRLILKQVVTTIAVVVGFLAVMSASLPEMILQNVMENEESDSRAAGYIAFVRGEIETNPAYALSLLSDSSLVGTQDSPSALDPDRHALLMEEAMLDLLAVNYPEDFDKSGSPDAERIKGLTNQGPANVEISTDEGDGRVSITDLERGIQHEVVVSGPLSCWAVDEQGDYVALAADREVYLYDVDGYTDVVSLSGNHEPVDSLRFYDGNVCAITEKGNVITWDNPLMARSTDRMGNAVIEADLEVDADGNPIGVFLDGGRLVVCGREGERAFSLPHPDGTPVGLLALSHDGSKVALAIDDVDDEHWLCVIDVASGELLLDIEMSPRLEGVTFSKDDTSVVGACMDGSGLVEVSVADGTMAQSDPSDFIGYTVVPYRDGYLLSGDLGQAIVYDGNLKPRTETFMLHNILAPAKQLAVSEDQGYAFMASRGGNHSIGCARANLANGELHEFALPTDDGMVSNTSVVTNADGSLVAFGYPDGSVRIWTTDDMDLVYEGRSMGEQVSALAFSTDGRTLHAMGGSGTLYDLEVGPMLEAFDSSDRYATWFRYVDMANAIEERLDSIGMGANVTN